MIPSYLIPEVSLNGGAHRRSMASIEHVDSPKRQVTDVTSASIEEEEAQPTEVWAEKTEEAIQHENSEKTEKSQEPRSNLLRIQSHAYRILQTCHGVEGVGGSNLNLQSPWCPETKDWRTRMRNRASTFDFSSFRLMRATKTTRSRPGQH